MQEHIFFRPMFFTFLSDDSIENIITTWLLFVYSSVGRPHFLINSQSLQVVSLSPQSGLAPRLAGACF